MIKKPIIQIPEGLFDQINGWLNQHLGIFFTKEKSDDLIRRLEGAKKKFNFDETLSFIHWLLTINNEPAIIQKIATSFTIGETYFFRDHNLFNQLENKIIPDLYKDRIESKTLRIWSMASATGEEPYSIAILLEQMKEKNHALNSWNFNILATDVNTEFLEIAKKGIYREWSFRQVPEEIKKRYFKKDANGHYHLDPKIKKKVWFNYFNIVKDPFPAPFNGTAAIDLIICCNVLIYFSLDQISKVVNQIAKTLQEKGVLITSASESSFIHHSHLKVVHEHSSIHFKKMTDTKQDIPTPLLPPLSTPNPELIFTKKISPHQKSKPLLSSFEQGKFAFLSGDYIKAIAYFEEALKKEKNMEETSNLLIQAYCNAGKNDKALKECQRRLLSKKIDPSLYYLEAILLEDKGKLDEAILSLKKALFLNRHYVMAYFSLGIILQKKGFIKEAKKALDNALNILNELPSETIIPESSGMTAGHMKDFVLHSYPMEDNEGK